MKNKLLKILFKYLFIFLTAALPSFAMEDQSAQSDKVVIELGQINVPNQDSNSPQESIWTNLFNAFDYYLNLSGIYRHFMNAGDLPVLEEVSITVADQARCAYRLGRFKECVDLYTIALEKNPNLSATHYTVTASAYFMLENWEKSSKFYIIALEREEKLSFCIYLDAIKAHVKLGNLLEVRKILNIASRWDKKQAILLYVSTGSELMENSYWKESAKFYKTALQNDENSVNFHYGKMGYVHAKVEKIKEASHYFQKFIDNIGNRTLKLPSDALEIMMDVLTDTKADEKYLEWLNGRKEKESL